MRRSPQGTKSRVLTPVRAVLDKRMQVETVGWRITQSSLRTKST
jgi:hypothetical protein